MKKYILILILIFSTNAASAASAETDCPFGLVNDPEPGVCTRYVDADDNALCDLSEVPLEKDYGLTDKSEIPYLSEEKLKSMSVKEVAEVYGIETSAYRSALSEFLKIEVKGGETLLDLHDNNGLCSGVAANIALGIKNKQPLGDIPEHDLISGEELKLKKVYEIAEIYSIDQNKFANALSEHLGTSVKLTETIGYYHDKNGLEASIVKEIANGLADGDVDQPAIKNSVSSVRYKFLPIFAITALLYGITLFFAKRKTISILTHKRIWNSILLISFIVSAILAILLIIRINWGWYLVLPFNMLYWHVETGTVMLVISLFHIFEHRRFYTCMIAAKKKGECDGGGGNT